ncbi:MAG: endonuclease, partial [Prolixibacteraceae bacterium]|nr:endonuclease [Prolixibacteraceae bacterium]
MRVRFTIALLLLIPAWMLAQPPGYYNGTEGLKGAALKAQLHEIISQHVDFSYSQAKFIINYSDADPANEKNVILFYTQRSQNADTYGSGGDFINREHVWAKSHGAFADMRPMDGDAFNLRPADASVNENRSNKDFGNVKPNGTQHTEATECWYTSQRWEPGDATKGQVARIILYMDTRYEGTNGELNLTAVNGFNTSPQPEHGDLATLLEWNRQFPPTDFERRRNERIFSIQQNRNPFVDHPEWADLIWADAALNPIQINNLQMEPEFPQAGSEPVLSFSLAGVSVIDEARLYWGKTPNSEEWTLELDRNNTHFQVPFSLSGFQANEMVYFKIVIKTRDNENSMEGSFRLPRNVTASQLTPITDIQGTTDISPLSGQIVNLMGTIVANFDNTVYIQTGQAPYSGVCVYGSLITGHVGDSVVVTGKVEEFNRLTEITNVSYFYNHHNNKAVEPVIITASQVGEAYEGMLVTIENVSFDNGGAKVPDSNVSYTFWDATGSATVFSRYSSRLLNKQIPTGITNVTGVVSQYQNDYQILPRDILDFSAGNDTLPPQVLAVTAIDKSWITVDFDERVDQLSSENIENYVFSGSIQALSAYRYEEATTVIINVEGLTTGTHSLTISGIKDQNNNEMEPVTFEFDIVISSVDVLKATGLKVYPNPVSEGFF